MDPGGSAPFQPRFARAGTLHAERLFEGLGRELSCAESVRRLRCWVQSLRPPAVGAMRVTCSDECEQENVEAFQRQFVRYLLPDLKFSSKAPFRTANLGGRYEWGSVRIAEGHYALARGAGDWKVLVVRLSSHVALDESAGARSFGSGRRYDGDFPSCGALAAVLAGSPAPFARRLAEDLDFGGEERVAELLDPGRVDPGLRSLCAALLNARLQARRAVIDVQDHRPATPTLWVVQAAVTVNRGGHDSEVPCALYFLDRRGPDAHDELVGLGDRPGEYRLSGGLGPIEVRDADGFHPRRARDHRALVRASLEPGRARVDEPLGRALADARALVGAREPRGRAAVSRAVLKTLLAAASAAAPVPAALLLFGEGLVHIHHAAQAHRLVREAEGDPAARRMLAEIEDRIDRLDPDEARHLTELLLHAYGR